MIETMPHDGTLPLTRHALSACWRYRNTPDRDRERVAQWAGLSAEECRALERLDANLQGCPLPDAPIARDIPRYLAGTYLPTALDALAVSRHDAKRLARVIAPNWMGAEEVLMQALKNGWPASGDGATEGDGATGRKEKPVFLRERLLAECGRRGWDATALPEGGITVLEEALDAHPQSIRTALRRLTGAAELEKARNASDPTDSTDSTDLTESPPAEPERLGDRIRQECARRGWDTDHLPRGATKALAAALEARVQSVGTVIAVMRRNALVAQAKGERPPPPPFPIPAAAAGNTGAAGSGCAQIAAAAASVTHVMLEAGLESIANEELRGEIRKLCLAVLAMTPLPKK